MSPRIPGRHDMPLEPLVMTEADAVAFAQQVASGFNGQAPWRRKQAHEYLVIWLHPDAVNYLPPDVRVQAVGNQYDSLGFVQFNLVRDYDSRLVKVVRSGVREETTVYTSEPEEGSIT